MTDEQTLRAPHASPSCFAWLAEDRFVGQRVVWRFEPDFIGEQS